MRSIAWFAAAWLVTAALIPSYAGASEVSGDATISLRATVRRHATITLPTSDSSFTFATPLASSNATYTRTAEIVWRARRPTLLVSVILD